MSVKVLLFVSIEKYRFFSSIYVLDLNTLLDLSCLPKSKVGFSSFLVSPAFGSFLPTLDSNFVYFISIVSPSPQLTLAKR